MTRSLKKLRKALILNFNGFTTNDSNEVLVTEFKIVDGLLCMTFKKGKTSQSMQISANAAIEKGIIDTSKLKLIVPPNMI